MKLSKGALAEVSEKYHEYYLGNKDKWQKYNETRKKKSQIEKTIKKMVGGIK